MKGCFRDESADPNDNGWHFLGADDTEEYINVVENNIVVDFNTVANIEPAVLALYDMPIGTDLYVERGTDKKIRFFRTETREELKFEL